MFSENIIPRYLLPKWTNGNDKWYKCLQDSKPSLENFLNLVHLMWQSNYITRGKREGQSVKNNVLDYSREVLEANDSLRNGRLEIAHFRLEEN